MNSVEPLKRSLKAFHLQLGRLGLAFGVIALVLAVVLAFAVIQRISIHHNFGYRGDSPSYLVSQLEREYLRLRESLQVALRQPALADREALALRSNILASRLELVQKSPVTLEISNAPEYTATVSTLTRLIQHIEEALVAQALDVDALQSLLNDTEPPEAPLQALGRLATITMAMHSEAAFFSLLSQNGLILLLTAFQLLFLSLAALSMSQRSRQREKERHVLTLANQQLLLNEEKLNLAANVFKHAHESIIIADDAGMVLEVNENFVAETQFTQHDLLGLSVKRLFSSNAEDAHAAETLFQWVDRTGHWSGEQNCLRKDGTEYPAMVSISAVRSAEGITKSYVLFFNDITGLKKQQEELEYVAHYDVLTDLPNRSLFRDRLQKAISSTAREQKLLAVAFLDLDGFKEVNDKHGHTVGDQLLVGLAGKMQHALRAGDSIARLGGDEFVALIIGLNEVQDCIPVLDRLLHAASSQVTVNGIALSVSASVGVTIYPDDNVNADQLVRHADQAMYSAKQSGKNQYAFFDFAGERAFEASMASLPEIKLALERSEFLLYYQPKVHMQSGRLVGLEALIRWQHPVKGLLSPAAFLPQIESMPISLELSRWVISAALSQMDDWLKQGLKLPVSINVGALHLQHKDFQSDLQQCLSAYPACEGMLSIEILETSALSDIDRIRETMQRCQALGVEFALDDFGTGYSSLTYLSDLPAHELKIDQRFVKNIASERNHLSIVEAVVSLARAFRRSVIAEGVETVEAGERLLQLGCELGQGYCIARPMAAGQVPQWLRDWMPPSSWKEQIYIPKEPQLLLNELIRNAPVGIAIIDGNGIFKNVNLRYCSIYGYERSELIGTSFTLLFPQHDRPRMLELNRKFVFEGGELKGTWQVHQKDGTQMSVVSESVRLPGIEGEAHRLVYVTTNG